MGLRRASTTLGRVFTVLRRAFQSLLGLGARTGELAASTPPLPNAYIYNWQVALASNPDVS